MNIDEYDFNTKVGTDTTASLDLPDFKLEFVETSSLQELLEICRQINP